VQVLTFWSVKRSFARALRRFAPKAHAPGARHVFKMGENRDFGLVEAYKLLSEPLKHNYDTFFTLIAPFYHPEREQISSNEWWITFKTGCSMPKNAENGIFTDIPKTPFPNHSHHKAPRSLCEISLILKVLQFPTKKSDFLENFRKNRLPWSPLTIGTPKS
jgi:hypothetical protein